MGSVGLVDSVEVVGAIGTYSAEVFMLVFPIFGKADTWQSRRKEMVWIWMPGVFVHIYIWIGYGSTTVREKMQMMGAR